MRYRPLGRTGWEVSELGLGTYPLGGALQTSGSYWSGPATYGAVTAEVAVATIRSGLEQGLNFIDTAPVYGEAEAFIGKALPTASPTARACCVTTKCGEHVHPNPDGGPPVLARDFSRSALRASLARSRERLAVDRFDIVLLHSPSSDEMAEDPLGLLVELRERGEIAHVGVSARSVEQGIELIEQDGRSELLQIPFNLLEPAAAERLLPLAADHRVGIVVKTPLASGFLTGTISEEHVFGQDDYRSTMSRDQIARLARTARAFMWLLDEGVAGSLSEAALRYILSFPAVSTVIAGSMCREELQSNLDAARAGPLPPETLARIRDLQRNL